MAAGSGVASAGPQFQNVQVTTNTAFFLPKPALERDENRHLKGNSGDSTHEAKLPCAKGPLRPSNSAACRQTNPKRLPKALEFVHIGRQRHQTKNTPHLGLRGSKRDFGRTEPTRNHPLLVVSSPQNCPNQRLDPVRRRIGLQPAAGGSPKRWVPKVHWVQKSKDCFQKGSRTTWNDKTCEFGAF